MGSGFAKKKKQMKAMQEQFGQMQASMQQSEFEGSAGNGLVTVTINGEHQMKQLRIKPDCVDPDDIEGLEDLICAAYNDANSKMSESTLTQMPGMDALGSLGL